MPSDPFRLLRPVPGRLQTAAPDVLISAVAAAVAWLIAERWLGHQAPVFAPICAIVSLAPGLPSHGRQAIGLISGMAIGIIIGDCTWLLFPPDAGQVGWVFQLITAVVLSMLIASAFGSTAVMPIQAAVSVVLVLVLGPQQAGLHRLIDGAVGVAVGLACSQLLLTPDPVRQLRRARNQFLAQTAIGLSTAAHAIERGDAAAARTAEGQLLLAGQNLRNLADTVGNAQSSTRWSLRGRLASASVASMAGSYIEDATHLFASSLLLAEGLIHALQSDGQAAPPGLADRLRDAADHCAKSQAGAAAPSPAPTAAIPPAWSPVAAQLGRIERRLTALLSDDRPRPAD